MYPCCHNVYCRIESYAEWDDLQYCAIHILQLFLASRRIDIQLDYKKVNLE